jgi:type IV secretory pathway VirB2 component (pilin)
VSALPRAVDTPEETLRLAVAAVTDAAGRDENQDVAAALGLGRAARSMLYELQGHDPVAVAIAVVLLAGVALAAGYIPARRAARVNPTNALRYD